MKNKHICHAFQLIDVWLRLLCLCLWYLVRHDDSQQTSDTNLKRLIIMGTQSSTDFQGET
ncbi:hypothetical protein T02_1847 [Trichinella nativa]|uniref:Uncharacterized protein n=2 Tax=Trichinella TaxID=6333 RepID=A0A0V1L5K4_9BILA|nr:hypothetical protein T03_14222 [Trichinella britovi]KRZ54781.1 hypothetical protein T02_1847 [Trichinella nativa]